MTFNRIELVVETASGVWYWGIFLDNRRLKWGTEPTRTEAQLRAHSAYLHLWSDEEGVET